MVSFPSLSLGIFPCFNCHRCCWMMILQRHFNHNNNCTRMTMGYSKLHIQPSSSRELLPYSFVKRSTETTRPNNNIHYERIRHTANPIHGSIFHPSSSSSCRPKAPSVHLRLWGLIIISSIIIGQPTTTSFHYTATGTIYLSHRESTQKSSCSLYSKV